ncbi:hypothetical protein GGR21_001213 [Dysgonomonas hofstadii]|uniref:Fimbrillin-A associated anchor protein Mfa1 and Mfa2 n=1 Tax=Dysgonomonas hofstadii TaxID=637886 RepID=A0A840CP63_9BACT|nr:FimB/Mfa2 family fimbrial subunit [Dysgonomonas hofstadii]MBB4035324.1 hypothetical protein [Dysgonomonas hofstadii]
MNKSRTIYLSFDSLISVFKACMKVIILTLLLLLSGCDGDKVTDEDDSSQPAPNVTMSLKSGSNPVFMSNALIYVFRNNDQFVERKWNVTKNGNVLSTYMNVGTWNLVLLTCDKDIQGDIILPPYGGDNSNPMWKTEYTTPAEEFLSQTPAELRYASLPGVVITETDKREVQATLDRNVAKIQVILEEYSGFDNITAGVKDNNAFVDLLSVPTTLNWAGGYYPDKDNPDNSGNTPIREYLNFKYDTNNELVADTVNFIVPAHRGLDALDITTHKLRFKISMPLKGESYFGKTETPIEISHVPKVNSIIQLKLNFRGEPGTNLDLKVTVKDWVDVDQEVTFE